MQIYGIDFTSRPGRRKPMTCVSCNLDRKTLTATELHRWEDFRDFERFLLQPDPYIAGIDFPFGMPRRFIENIGWPTTWPGYVSLVGNMTRQEFRNALDSYRERRPPGDKEHRRRTDIASGALSPQKLSGTPVGLMFYEGAPRLYRAGVTAPGLLDGDPQRVVVEAYPGLLARSLIGRLPYKQDVKARQTNAHRAAREELLARITTGHPESSHGINVNASRRFLDDPGADDLDALLCAIQAAWAWRHRHREYGMPRDTDPLEGWISDPKGM